MAKRGSLIESISIKEGSLLIISLGILFLSVGIYAFLFDFRRMLISLKSIPVEALESADANSS
jgi:hypothetical protein